MIDAYKIGVSIAMTNGVSSVLGVIAKDVMGLHGHVRELEAGFGRVRVAMLGAAGVMGGAAVLGVFKELANAAKEFRVEQTRLVPAGFTADQARRATRQAWDVTTSTPGANLEHALAHQREMREILGDAESARRASPLVEQMAVALHAQTGVDAENGMKSLLKAVEMQAQQRLFDKEGKFDEGTFKTHMDAAYRFLVAANGFVKPEAMNQMMQQAGTSAEMMEDPFKFWRTKLHEAIEQGASRAGTGDAALWRALMNGTLPGINRRAAWHNVGLGHSDGKDFRMEAGPRETFAHEGEDAFITKWLLPALQKHGVTTPDAIRDWLSVNLPSETGRRNAVLNAANRVGSLKAQANYDSTMGFQEAYRYHQDNNPELKMKAFEEALHSFKVALGDPMLDTATGMLTKITAKINEATRWAAANPDAVQKIEKVIAVIGVASAAGGAILLAGAAFTALSGALLPFVAGGGALLALYALAGPDGLAAVGSALVKLKDYVAEFAQWARSVSDGLGLTTSSGGGGISPDKQRAINNLLSGRHSDGRPLGAGEDPSILGEEMPVPPSMVHKSSFLQGYDHGGGARIQTITYVQLDKRTIARAVSEEQGRRFSGPENGTSGFSGRVSPLTPGGLVSA